MTEPDKAFHPAVQWREEAARPGQVNHTLRLRLAAMAGHMEGDRRAARRGALIDLLADGRPHSGEVIIRRLTAVLGSDPWDKRPDEALLRDIAALRRGGIRVAYSRRRGTEGYYLQHPALAWPTTDHEATPVARPPTADQWTRRLRDMSVPEKNEAAFGAADFALRQKRLILTEERPDWTVKAIDREARRLVFGA
jgi:hypothetical protein